MTVKFTVQDILDAYEKAISPQELPQTGSEQLLQDLKEKARPLRRPTEVPPQRRI